MKRVLHSPLIPACWVSKLRHRGEEPRLSTLKLPKELRKLRKTKAASVYKAEHLKRESYTKILRRSEVCSSLSINTCVCRTTEAREGNP